MKTYLVQCIDTCPECGGFGVVVNPLWKDYAAKAAQDEQLTPDRWAWHQGYDSVEELGDEEVLCDQCEGTGKITRPVLLQEALEDLQRIAETT